MTVMVMGMATLSLTLEGLHLTKRVQQNTLAFNLAESGAERAMRWLKDQATPPSGTATLDPFNGAQALAGGSYAVTLIPDPNNSGAVLKAYTINASGTYGARTESVRLLARQQSFGKYAYFTDREISAASGGRIWFYSGDRIRGPAHSNNASGSDFQIDWSTSTGPIFQDMVTAVSSNIDYSPSDPATEAEFSKVYKAGSRGFHLGVDPIALPNSSDAQKNAAWGSSSGFPSTTGVYVNAGGGIYVHGNAGIVMSTDGAGNQVFTVTQGSTVTKVTVDLGANEIRKQVGSGAVVTTTGVGTQVLFCSGNISSLSGTIANNKVNSASQTIEARSAYTIATDVNNGKNITVTDNIKYATAPDVSKPYNDPANLSSGTLGLIARNVTVASGSPTALEVDGIILTGSSTTSDGSFSVADYNSKTPTGRLKVVGGIIQKARGPVGTLSGGTIATGYTKDYWYDGRLADSPPPFFPTTGLYDRISWQRLAIGQS
ncbi:MAG: hypothetical protein QOJ65_1792 [Fimbriimonadaceae bacterium]|nr:hypothetical protein [Fimbriimonadaceae bacterium]